MNRTGPFERLSKYLALLLTVTVFLGLYKITLYKSKKLEEKRPQSIQAVNLNFEQIALQAEVSTEKPKPKPEPEVVQEKQEKADIAQEKIIEQSVVEVTEAPLEPKIEEEVIAQVTQEASAKSDLVETEVLFSWVKEQIEREKYYPLSAQRMGLTGAYELLVKVDETGEIESAEIIGGHGHSILNKALLKMLKKVVGKQFEIPIGAPQEIELEFRFEKD